MNTFLIIWVIVAIFAIMLSIFLDAIDVVDGTVSGFIALCIAMPPVAIVAIMMLIANLFHQFCSKHKDKIRKFLKIKE